VALDFLERRQSLLGTGPRLDERHQSTRRHRIAPSIDLSLLRSGQIPHLCKPRCDLLPILPVQIADLAQELWQRATVAAAVDLKGGAAAHQVAMRSGEADALRQQNDTARSARP
jgi:hypothetical protein